MLDNILLLLLLALIIIFFIVFLWYIKKTKKSKDGFQDAASTTLVSNVYVDSTNPTLKTNQLYGKISQATSIAIFKAFELLTAVDTITESEGDSKTGNGAGLYLTLTTIPDQPPPPDDIETLLNAVEGFQDGQGGYTDAQRAQAGGTIGGISAVLNIAPYALSAAKKNLTKINLIKTAAIKSGQTAAKVSARVATFAAKTTAKIGVRAAAMTAAGNTALVAGAATTATVVGAPVGIATMAVGAVLLAMAATSVAISVAMASTYPDGGVCENGWKRVSSEWPDYIDFMMSLLPGIGDLFSPVAPYMCYTNGCADNQEESAGFCYPKCDFGYTGSATMCNSKYETIGPGVLKDCPSGYTNTGLQCQEDIVLDGCDNGSHDVAGTCWSNNFPWYVTKNIGERRMRGGTLLGRMNNDSRLRCPSDHPDEIDGLCYRSCPTIGIDKITTTITPYPIYIRKLTSTNQDVAKIALSNALANPKSSEKLIADLQTDLTNALIADMALAQDPNAPYVRNPSGPRLAGEPAVIPPIPRRWPVVEPPAYINIIVGIKNNRVVFYTPELGWVSFETIFGSYGRTLDADGQVPVKVSMSEIGPQILTQTGRLYRWNVSKVDWEWNNWGIFKDIAAANNSFTYGIGMDNEPYIYRWADNKRGFGVSGIKVGSGWSWLTAGIAANNWPINSDYDTIMKTADHGNMFSTNSLAEGHIAIDWDKRYLWSANDMFRGINPLSAGNKPTCVAMTPKFNTSYYIATNQGYIFKFTGLKDTNHTDKPGVDPRSDPSRVWIPGPVGAGSITAMTVDTDDILYVICANGKLYRQVPSPNTAPSTTVQVPSGLPIYNACANSINGWDGKPICIGGFKQALAPAPNPNYDAQMKIFNLAKNAVGGWFEIFEKDGVTSSSVSSISICPSLTNDQSAVYDAYTKYISTMNSVPILTSAQPLFTQDLSGNYTVPFTGRADGTTMLYPVPSPTVKTSDIPTILQSVTLDPSQKLEHCKGAPYQCIPSRGLSYDRGLGKAKLQIKMVSPTPADPIPSPAWVSSYWAEGTPTYSADFSTPSLLQQMCYFYYKSVIEGLAESSSGSLDFSYISKITGVIASSERTADVICDITAISIDPDTKETTSSVVTPGADRRFYFAVVKKTGSYVVTGATNFNLSTSYILSTDASGNIITDASENIVTSTLAKKVSVPFIPTTCPQTSLTLDQCMKYVPKMVSKYNADDALSYRIITLNGIVLSGVNTCSLDWVDIIVDSDTNTDLVGTESHKTATFTFEQSTATIACVFTIKSFVTPAVGNPIAQLPTPKKYGAPPPKPRTGTGAGSGSGSGSGSDPSTCKSTTDTSKWPHKLTRSSTACKPTAKPTTTPTKKPEIYIPPRYFWTSLF